MTAAPILLTGYDAKRCARRVHNEWDPAIEKTPWEVPPELQMRFDAGNAFEDVVLAELREALGADAVDLTDLRGKDAAVAATLSAMDAGARMILGGWLPDDVVGGRTGRPDLLLRGDRGYVPGDVKGHKVTRKWPRGTLRYSLLGAPDEVLEAAGYSVETTAKLDDYLQLAHYRRLLEACGRHAPGPATGFVIGSDLLADLAPGHLITWMDLDAPAFTTYSRTHGTARRSAMDRYDHEQGFRLKVATAAAAGEPALVEPIFTEECDGCPWYDHCRAISADDAASRHITSGRLDIREWRALAAAGVQSVAELAALDPDDPAFLETYLPEVAHRKDAPARLAVVVRRAAMSVAGRSIERETTGPVPVPTADVEIDFDIEWDVQNRAYLWGALVRRPGEEPTFVPVVSWDELDDAGAVDLAQQFADWLRSEIAAADAAGRSLMVFHYANPEPNALRKLLGADAVADLLEHFVDLLPIVKEHYFGLAGLGLKKVAPEFGFRWRDDDPGGLQSQLWLIEARDGGTAEVRDAHRARILAYNEDDVRATAAVRAGMRTA